MRFACWMTKARDICSERGILTAFSRQKWLRERPSVLRHMCTVSLVPVLCGYNTKNLFVFIGTRRYSSRIEFKMILQLRGIMRSIESVCFSTFLSLTQKVAEICVPDSKPGYNSSYATRLLSRRCGFPIPAGEKNTSSPKRPDLFCSPHSPLFNGHRDSVPGVIHTPPSSAEAMNRWSYTSPPTYMHSWRVQEHLCLRILWI
jgi:hypothetical protein